MDSPRKSNRRDFLQGRAAFDAVQDLAERVAPPEPPSPLLAARLPASYLMEFTRRAMATDFQILLDAARHGSGSAAALEALDLVETIETQLTVYREPSEVVDLNRRAAREAVAVESRLFALLETCSQLSAETGGAFDITSTPLSKVWGFYRREGRFPEDDVLREALSRVGSRWVELDPECRTVRFRRDGLEINLNAIGKGYAVDRCAEILRGRGVDDFLIHGGQSSVLARGSRLPGSEPGTGWLVGLRHPLKTTQRIAEIRLADRALGTSGSGVQFFYHRGRRYGHVLDPRTGLPVEGVLSTTVLAPDAARADALSTAFFVLGLERTREYCQQHPELSVLMVCPGQRAGSIALHPLGLADGDWRLLDATGAEAGESR